MRLSWSHSEEHRFGAISVSILQWHAEIGIFNTKHVKYPFKPKYPANVCPQIYTNFIPFFGPVSARCYKIGVVGNYWLVG